MDHLKLLGALAVLTFIFQIVFSFFYSSDTITQNNHYYQSTKQLEKISDINNHLKIKYASASSIFTLRQQLQNKGLSPITQTFEAENP